jgi:hypothetical protein
MDRYLLIMVLDDSNRLNEVLEAWRSAGVQGITIFESTGMNRVLPRHAAQPMFAGFSQVFGGGRVGHHTLFAIIDSMDLAEAAVGATEAVIGSLNDPHTGVVCVTPVVKVWGIPEES